MSNFNLKPVRCVKCGECIHDKLPKVYGVMTRSHYDDRQSTDDFAWGSHGIMRTGLLKLISAMPV